MILGKLLSAYRILSALTVRALAKEIGIPFATLNRIERGSEMDLETFKKISDWFMKGEIVAKKRKKKELEGK